MLKELCISEICRAKTETCSPGEIRYFLPAQFSFSKSDVLSQGAPAVLLFIESENAKKRKKNIKQIRKTKKIKL